jgi:hypothetical protein
VQLSQAVLCMSGIFKLQISKSKAKSHFVGFDKGSLSSYNALEICQIRVGSQKGLNKAFKASKASKAFLNASLIFQLFRWTFLKRRGIINK